MAEDAHGFAGPSDEEDARDRLIAELREAVFARDEFVAIAAHELRNPMTPILMQVGSLAAAIEEPGGCVPHVLRPRVELLQVAVQEFLRRATALLDTSRITSGQLTLERSVVDFSEVARDVLRRQAIAAQLARCEVQADLADRVVGRWDRMALEQITENLVSNAIKFGAGAPVVIRVSAHGQRARLMVRDNGIGIPEADRERIFERFERAVTRREHGGFGVGLWLSNQLVRAMDGTMHVSSEAGQGASFEVDLPLDERDGEREGAV
ncbi:HAMP domain-containing histidine kinase [Roseomonas hellenica]|uniref:histidine kinase n=1 Tax=Plastoroseomonas hellenica TaxID=2687306 RepID=A0ABS5EVY0_9PROT|nr:HAMP domain-containing sensor histidine kinase [Plastoroseomonas hellenica]MBR0664461.1 HAMP domain-containing histidine kinase [Plastoroseomonas hellenica]